MGKTIPNLTGLTNNSQKKSTSLFSKFKVTTVYKLKNPTFAPILEFLRIT
jgi:hypothetical protein